MLLLLNFGWPQAIALSLIVIGIALRFIKHGQPMKEVKFNGWLGLIRAGLWLWLLIAGGFFNPACAQSIPATAHTYRADLVRAARAAWGLNAPVAVLAAQVHQESGWRPGAVSHVGAQGLGQFMPGTATWWCDINGLTPADCQPNNPVWALRALAGYDKWLFDRAPQRYSDRDRMHVALRAYNGGLGHWQAEAKATGLPQPTVDQVAAACGQARRHVAHCKENLAYPHRILDVLQPRYVLWGPGL